MALRNFFGESGTNAAATHTIPLPDGCTHADFRSLTISTHGGDVAADVEISILDGGRKRWGAWLRSDKLYGAHFSLIGKIILANKPTTLQIYTGAGGANVIVSVACVIEANVNENAGSDSF